MDVVANEKKTPNKKKIIIIISCVLAAVVLFMAGCLVGGLFNNQEEPNIVGVYRAEKWKGRENATLILNESGWCQYPTRVTGTWTLSSDDEHIIIRLDGTTSTEVCTIAGGGAGILIDNVFFEKID